MYGNLANLVADQQPNSSGKGPPLLCNGLQFKCDTSIPHTYDT